MGMIDYEKELNPGQLEAVRATDGPVLVLAGAGSGKTRTLIYRVCHLLEMGADPKRILLVTFTNKAAKEMRDRAEEMLGPAASQITACTYHSFCTKMLRKYAAEAGLSQNFTILSGNDPETIISMMETELGYDNLTGFPRARDIVKIISESVNKELPIELVIHKGYRKIAEGDWFREIRALREAADSYKRENSLLDYDDIMVHFYELLVKYPDIAEEIDDMFDYISVDEYQDTNSIQAKIIKEIRKKNRNLCVVGDDYQCIYNFRGSDIRNILRFSQDYPGAKVVYLTENYRSTPQIVDLSNVVMHENAESNLYAKTLHSSKEPGMKPALVKTKSQLSAAKIIADNIEKAHGVGRAYKDICILARNTNSTPEMEAELLKKGIPYEKRGGPKFFDQAFIRDVLSYIRIFTNGKDELSWFRVTKLHKGIGEAAAREIAAGCRVIGAGELNNPKYAGKSYETELEALGDFIRSMDSCLSVSELVAHCNDFYIKMKTKLTYAMNTDEENRQKLLAKIKKEKADLHILTIISRGYESAVDFLDAISFDQVEAVQEEGAKNKNQEDKVVLSTIHSAKGLEFDTVYVLDCVDGIFPSTEYKDIGTAEDQEELRCFYVAATRAKRNLFLMIPAFCKGWKGNVQKRYPSHFLKGAEKEVKVYSK